MNKIKFSFRSLVAAIIISIGSLSLVACAGINQLGVRSANDLNCPESEVHITDIGAHAFQAVGCGRRATYVCDNHAPAGSFIQDIRCTREAEMGSNNH